MLVEIICDISLCKLNFSSKVLELIIRKSWHFLNVDCLFKALNITEDMRDVVQTISVLF